MNNLKNTLYLPISIGEALDKLSILNIKIEEIKDHRYDDVKKEYDILFDFLKDYVDKYSTLYNLLKGVNKEIWEYMDVLRDGNLNDEEYFKINKKTIIKNDVRFRIKNKINLNSKSYLKEQKAYNITSKSFFLKDEESIITAKHQEILNLIIEESLNYDEIFIFCNLQNYDEIIKYFDYDKTVNIKLFNKC